MATIFNLSLNDEYFGCIFTAIGDLCLFSISYGDQSDLHKSLSKEIDKCDPEEYIREFSRYVCYPKASLRDGKYKLATVVLEKSDSQKLEISDLENISKLYIENNKYLYSERISKHTKNDQGDTVISEEYGQTIHPKLEDESWSKYLHRLLILEEEELKRQNERLIKSVLGASNFSNNLMRNISGTLSMGESFSKALERFHNPLGEAIESLRKATSMKDSYYDSIKNIEPFHTPPIDFAKITRNQEKIRRQPFNELGERLDELIDVSVKSGGFIVETNKTQIQIANEIKASSDSSYKHSKINIWMTIIVIILTVAGLLITGVSVYLEYQASSKRQNDIATAYYTLSKSMNGLVDKMEKVATTSQISNQQQLAKILEAQVKEKEKYTSLLKEQNLKIDNLAKQNQEQRLRIKILENQIKTNPIQN